MLINSDNERVPNADLIFHLPNREVDCEDVALEILNLAKLGVAAIGSENVMDMEGPLKTLLEVIAYKADDCARLYAHRNKGGAD